MGLHVEQLDRRGEGGLGGGDNNNKKKVFSHMAASYSGPDAGG